MAEPKKKRRPTRQRPGFYAAFYAVYYPYIREGVTVKNLRRLRRRIQELHTEFLDAAAASTSDWRVVNPTPDDLEKKKACPPFPSPRRRSTCNTPAICPWCYASEVEKLYHRVQAVVRAPENVGKWLVLTRQKIKFPIPQRTQDMSDDAYRTEIRAALLAVFAKAKKIRTAEHDADSRRKHITAALRYADVTRIWKLPPKKKKKGGNVEVSQVDIPEGGQADPNNYLIVSRGLLITTNPSPKHVVAEHVKRIDEKLKDSDIAVFVGKTMQQSSTFYRCERAQKSVLMFAKQFTKHRVFTTYGTLRGTNDETNTAAAD